MRLSDGLLLVLGMLGVVGCGDGSAGREVSSSAPAAHSPATVPAPSAPPPTSDSAAHTPPATSSSAVQTPPPAPSDVVRMPTNYAADPKWKSAERSAAAHKRAPVVEELFKKAGLTLPAAQVLLRAFKQENEVELWAASQPDAKLVKVATYGICYASGTIGPKRREGDSQVPEGIYTVPAFTSTWKYHLMMYLDYPNPTDRARNRQNPGSDIYIHGSCASIGCISMSDERMEELWEATAGLQNKPGARVHVHIFPARDIGALLAANTMPEHHELWRDLQQISDAFLRDGRIPKVTASTRYRLE